MCSAMPPGICGLQNRVRERVQMHAARAIRLVATTARPHIWVVGIPTRIEGEMTKHLVQLAMRVLSLVHDKQLCI